MSKKVGKKIVKWVIISRNKVKSRGGGGGHEGRGDDKVEYGINGKRIWTIICLLQSYFVKYFYSFFISNNS